MGIITLYSNIKLHNVLYVLKFSYNLILVNKLIIDLNCIVTYHATYCVIQVQNTRNLIGFDDFHDRVYVLKKTRQGSSLVAIQVDTSTL
uniref:Retrovirus-related Pol polyprotein from transposon TNT 1-94 n=2 Tax=Cajanus cajan TaxID=3821 RepID=A0A151SBV1_CAJCA|nr:hypothetical protein KK1_025772 [Cajanus cajan]